MILKSRKPYISKKEYIKNIMERLSKLANKDGMVSLDAVAEVVNQELDGSLHPSANEQF